MQKVFASAFVPEDIIAPLRAIATVDVWERHGQVPGDVLFERLSGCSGWLSMLTDKIDADLLDRLPDLRVISQMSVGVDNIDVAACRDHGVVVGHTPDVLTEATADTAFTLLSAIVRRLPEAAEVVKSGEWGPWDPWHFLSNDLHGSRLGIIGMGRIGQAIARRAMGFAMEVLYASRSEKQVPGARRVGLDELLTSSDIVVVAAPLNEETRGMIGQEAFGLMRKTAFLINVARGPLVDTNALVEALAGGTIGGAALDVTDPEPLPADHPLLAFPNCLVVPHIGSATIGARRAMAELAVANCVAYLEGRAMPAWLPGSAHPEGSG